jgi:hypothetical protein
VELKKVLRMPCQPRDKLPCKTLFDLICREYPMAKFDNRVTSACQWRVDGSREWYFPSARKAWLINDMYDYDRGGLLGDARYLCDTFPAIALRYWMVQFPRCMKMCVRGTCARRPVSQGNCCSMCFHRGVIFVLEIACPKFTKRARRVYQVRPRLTEIPDTMLPHVTAKFLQINVITTCNIHYLPVATATVGDLQRLAPEGYHLRIMYCEMDESVSASTRLCDLKRNYYPNVIECLPVKNV